MTDLPTQMKAVVLHEHGGMEALKYHTDWPMPSVGAEQVLIRVGACGMNNTDVNTRTGWYSKSVTGATDSAGTQGSDDTDPTWGGAPIGLPRIQGADTVGQVVAAGAKADQSLIGKRVITDNWLRNWEDPLNRETTGYYGSEADGGYAEYAVIDHRNARPVTSDLSDAELATFSCSYSTAEGMLWRAQVGAGDRVLITGASGGVGSALIQLAKRRGAMVIALSSPSKHDILRDLGADVVLERGPADLHAALHKATGHDKVSVVADIVGGAYFPTLLEALVRGGRYVTSGAIAGPIVDLDLRTLYLQDLTLHGSTVIPPQILDDLIGYIERGEVKPLLAATYPLSDFHAAQTAFIEKKHVGNFVVVPD